MFEFYVLLITYFTRGQELGLGRQELSLGSHYLVYNASIFTPKLRTLLGGYRTA